MHYHSTDEMFKTKLMIVFIIYLTFTYYLKFNNLDSYIQMGITESQPQPIQNQIQNQFEHPHLGNISVADCSATNGMFLKIYHFADQMMGNEKIRRFNTRIKKFSNPNYILQIKSVKLIAKHEMCSHNCDVELYFEKYTQNLASILSQRLKMKKNFTEKQIYIFLNKVLEALIFLQDNGFKNCHLDKNSIIFCNQKIKLIDLGIATNYPYQNFLDKMQSICGFYVAPQHLKDLKERNYQPYLSPKSDIFCLGMLILELACMEPLDSYYDYKNYALDYENLIHRVSKIMYSVQLKTLIASMLEFEPDLRIGLISSQQKVKKVLNLVNNNDAQNGTHRRRSSSTKMLKQLLTNSRRTITGSVENNSFVRKPSHSSISSMASLNTKQSNKKVDTAKYKDALMQNYQTKTLKNLIKNKISFNENVNTKTMSQFNKQNCNQQFNRSLQIYNHQQGSQNNFKLIQQARKKSFGTRTFFQTNCQSTYDQKIDHATPKINQYLLRINKPKKQQQSIFKLIQQDQNNGQNSFLQKQKNSISSKEPSCSPVLPVVPKVQETNSINKQLPIHQHLQEVTQFKTEAQIQTEKKPHLTIQTTQPSLSLRVKRSLDKMYKTTQSITSSEEKQQKNLFKNQYRKIKLSNNQYYEGQIQNGLFEGNGVMYSQEGAIIYKGSWHNNLYDGFGTVYNLQAKNTKANMHYLSPLQMNWIKYEGEFNKGEWQGFGTIYFAQGERFSGCVRNGQINGYGCFYENSNQMTSGIWINSKLQN